MQIMTSAFFEALQNAVKPFKPSHVCQRYPGCLMDFVMTFVVLE